MIISSVVLEDAVGLARVRIEGWRFAYRGIVPDAVLDQMDEAKEIERWKERIREHTQESFFLCAKVNDQVVGFCGGGKNRDLDPDFDSELFALYVLPELHRQGVGRALMQAGKDWLIDHGYCKMLVWVLRENLAARRFYEFMGGTEARDRFIEIGGSVLAEVGYGYDLDCKI